MKKVISISLLLVLSFNIGGYYLIFWVLQKTASIELIQQLDSNQYLEEETIELKIPLSLPYPLQQNGYERINGEFEYQQQRFKLVKQKLEHDTLFVVCIQDKKSEKLNSQMDSFTKTTQDLPISGKQKSSVISQLLKEYNSNQSIEIKNEVAGWCVVSPSTLFIAYPIFQHKEITSPPPKSFC